MPCTNAAALTLGAVVALSLSGATACAQNYQNSGPASANSAFGQLQNATSGQQTTGQTFDGGRTPTDALPQSQQLPPPPPPGHPVDTSK